MAAVKDLAVLLGWSPALLLNLNRPPFDQKELKMISDLFSTTLAQMYACSLENDTEQYKILSEHLSHLSFESISLEHELLRQAVICASMENFKLLTTSKDKSKTTSEYSTVHTWVRRNMAELIGLDVIDKFPSLESGRRPDFLVIDSNTKYPVECKKIFNKRSLNQLQQYMVEMGVDKGYAVATKKTIELPDSIIFIQSSSS